MSKQDATQTPAKTKSKFLQVTRVGTVFTFTLGNGWTWSVDVSLYPKVIRDMAELHGFEQLFRDGCAGLSKDLEYSAAEAFFMSKHDAFMAGDWSRKAPGLGYRIEDIVQGLMAFKGMGFDQADGLIRNGDAKKIREHLKKNVKFNAAVAQAAADRIAKMAEGAEEAAEEELEDLDFTAEAA